MYVCYDFIHSFCLWEWIIGGKDDKDRLETEIEEILEVANLINIAAGTGSIKSATSSSSADTSVVSSGVNNETQEVGVAKASSMGTKLAVECCQGCSTNLVRQQLFMTAMTRLADKKSAATSDQMMEWKKMLRWRDGSINYGYNNYSILCMRHRTILSYTYWFGAFTC